jgi:hypothetical protein
VKRNAVQPSARLGCLTLCLSQAAMTTLEKQNDRRGGFGSGQWLGISERKTNMKKDKNGEVTPVNKWRCETCDSEDMTPEQMKNHLHNKHGIKTEV